MKSTQLNHVALHVEDVERSCRFYREILLLEPIPRPPFTFPGAWFRLGLDQELHLIGGHQGQTDSRNRGNHFALLVDDIGAWEKHLQSTSVQAMPRKVRPDGAYQIFVVDPDGYYVELCSEPGQSTETRNP